LANASPSAAKIAVSSPTTVVLIGPICDARPCNKERGALVTAGPPR
jgi:hypothetical protein